MGSYDCAINNQKKYCNTEKSRNKRRETHKKKFLMRARERFGNKYGYEFLEGKGIIIYCPFHGPTTLMNRADHLRSIVGCKKCSDEEKSDTLQDFVNKSNIIHDSKYIYDNVVYINNTTPVEIRCEEHGSFTQLPSSHKAGHGCPKCWNEMGLVGYNEKEMFHPLMTELFDEDVVFQQQMSERYYVDAYIPLLKLVIEYDEHYHHRPKNITKDFTRQTIIEETENVSFYRIKDKDMVKDPVKVKNDLLEHISELSQRCPKQL
jgi:very-short-patch-repair endonuclease